MAEENYVLTMTPTTRPFWDAARRGEFMLPRCQDCHRFHWYPRNVCPYCSSQRLEWRPASGEGTVETFTQVERRMHLSGVERPLPFVVAIVRLAEGPAMTTNIVNCSGDDLRIGLKVRVTFEEVGLEAPTAVFAPA
jgi:uncharacterized OB-fold protein